ncbi:TonB-dependent receptor [Neptunicella sp. SCSIO 80796]|uniref:TonB-dependent receptor n=1 Tax=Neptunicella plasticusilytica TaxID=3117012 RepID=UPI003A4E0710
MGHKLSKIALAIISVSAVTSNSLAHAQQTEAQSNADESLEIIEVKGMLGSLKAAALVKRSDARIVDAIVAEDIGKLPDNNIAEALQRVTGVSISRDFGVGNSVSIRGLKQNRVELNGRSTVGDGREGVSFDDFPSSFLKTVEVIKSPTPEMVEGALGGTISMKTVRPLDLKKPVAAMSFDAEYADKTNNTAPIFNASAGTNWDLGDMGTFGVMGMVSYQDRELRRDQFFNRVQAYDHSQINADENGVDHFTTGSTKTPSGKYLVADQNTVEQKTEKRERTAVNLSLQWAPSEDGFIYVDLNATKRSGSQDAYSVLDIGGSIVATADTVEDEYGQLNNYVLQGAYTIPKTLSSFRETDSYSNAIGGEWYLTDQLKISSELAIARSDTSRPAAEFNLRPINQSKWNDWATDWDGSAFNEADLRFSSDATVYRVGDKIPSVIYADGQIAAQPENLAVRDFFYDDTRTENEETAFRLDLTYSEPFGLNFVSALKTGLRTTKRDYQYSESSYDAKDLYKSLTKDGLPYAFWIDQVEAAFPGSVHTVNHSNSFDHSGLSGQNDLTTYRVYNGALLANGADAFNKIQSFLAGTNKATTGSLTDNLSPNNGAYRDITEETSAFYLQANLEFDDLHIVAGARYVNTDLSSTVYVDDELVNGTHDYDDVLPSLNLTYDLSDETIVRFAAAKVMRRADFNQLSPAFDIDNSVVTASRGAIDLAPFRATQYDLSVEHYFGQGNMVSAAIFYKDVDSFLSTQTYCAYDADALASQNQVEFQNICIRPDATSETDTIVTTNDPAQFAAYAAANRTGIATSVTRNGEQGKVQGFELGYQQSFDFLTGIWSGFGLSANYTYADSEQPNGNPLLDISKNTFNSQIYWEQDGVAVRLAYTFRDRFLDTEEEKRVVTIGARVLDNSTNDESDPEYDPTAGNNYREDTGQLDFSVSWDMNENITFVGNITNLTAEPIVFSTELGSNWKYSESDRRFTLGVRAKF